MKTRFLLLVSLLCLSAGFGQVGINTTTPSPASVLDVNASNNGYFGGFMPPRVTIAERNQIATSSADDGLLVFLKDGNERCLQVYDAVMDIWENVYCITEANASPRPWINEIHYDNTGIDIFEGVEIAGIAGLDLSGYRIIAYNGVNGEQYEDIALSGILTDQSNGYGFKFFAITPLQNGAPDGLALIGPTPTNEVILFLSYEGTFVATNNLARGLTSIDIGVSEDESFLNQSLQLTGTGSIYGDFTWAPSAMQTRDSVNNSQIFN